MPSASPARQDEYLLIDISNSYMKVAHASREKLHRVERFPTQGLTAGSFRRLAGKPEQRVVLSSVVPVKEDLARRAFSRHSLLRVNHRAQLGIEIDYPKPASIGGDRLANAAAVAASYGGPAIVIDFGTAVTFDILARPGRGRAAYVGGVIAPGLEAMTDYLYQRTALLPKIRPAEPASAIGKSTRQAMLAGAIYGYRGLVREILAEIRRELGARGRSCRLVATGGYAELIARGLPEIKLVLPHLTLEGLRIIGNLNFPP